MDDLTLFRIETDRVSLSWSKLNDKQSPTPKFISNVSGLLKIIPKRRDIVFSRIERSGIPVALAADLHRFEGPHLFEQCNYDVYASTAKPGDKVGIIHHDPLITQNLHKRENSRIHQGIINFGSQIGSSEFSVFVNGKPEFDFLVEIFPSKLDYKADYDEMIAEVQDVLTGLAFEYLRSTFKLGVESHVPQPTQLEWLYLLKNVANKLEEAFQQINRHPIRGLLREPTLTKAGKIKKIDSTIRLAVRRGAGSGDLLKLENGLKVRQMLIERRARTTLNTPEHRWLAAPLNRICQKISILKQQEALEIRTLRRDQAISELGKLECRMRALTKHESIATAQGNPPQGFTSLQLQGAPGYREAYQNCLILQLGLRIEGGPLRLSVKDLNVLYEYWCYIALLEIIAEETGQPISAKNIFSIRQQGLRVMLQKGKTTTVDFKMRGNRTINVVYNRFFKNEPVLVPQMPDMLITFHDPAWPDMHLILDAKYRLDSSKKYYNQYKSMGPPDDAINVLHRYRDAILEQPSIQSLNSSPKRTSVQAAALFPLSKNEGDDFTNSRLWMALDKIGIGAIPFLPGNTEYLRKWLRKMLNQGGWSLAKKAIRNVSDEKDEDWRKAASEYVLIGILRSKEKKSEIRHLEWIKQKKRYYIPVKESQRRFHMTKWIAVYLPLEIRKPGAVAYWAKVQKVEVVPRRKIHTQWKSNRDKDQLQFLYYLENFMELPQPIINFENGIGRRFSGHRWTSRLALERAKNLTELFLETEPEWRLYEDLKAENIHFEIKAGSPKVIDPDDPKGRALFDVNGKKIQYLGSGGFKVKTPSEDRYFASPSDVVVYLKGELDGA